MDHITTAVYEAIAEASGFHAEELKQSDRLAEDLELDSMDLVQLGQDIEDSLGIEIPDSAVRASMTVGEVVNEVRKLHQGE